MQLAVADNEHMAFFGNYPTLIDLNRGYQWNTAVKWLSVQLFDLSEYCGCKDKLTKRQLEQCADIITHGYGWMKVSEIMLFLVRFKAARYGRFYGSVDPMIILSALREFAEERQNAYFRHDMEERERKDMEERQGCVTWEEWKSTTKANVLHDDNPLKAIMGGTAV